MLQQVARLVACSLCEFCIVDLADEGRVRRIEIAHADASLVDRLRAAADAFESKPGGRIERIFATGEAELVSKERSSSTPRRVPAQDMMSGIHTRSRDFWDGFTPASYLSVPILVFGEVAAVLTLASRRPSALDADRLAFAVEIAGWCGLALEAKRGPLALGATRHAKEAG
jgi:GAF domain-containing protein